VAGCELNSSGARYGPVAGSFEHGNEPSDSIKRNLSISRSTVGFSTRTVLQWVSGFLMN
jgi:hypothetical protein